MQNNYHTLYDNLLLFNNELYFKLCFINLQLIYSSTSNISARSQAKLNGFKDVLLELLFCFLKDR